MKTVREGKFSAQGTRYRRRAFLLSALAAACSPLLPREPREPREPRQTSSATGTPVAQATPAAAPHQPPTVAPPTPEAEATDPNLLYPDSPVRLTPIEDFYTVSYHGNLVPEIDAATYRLAVEGHVERPLSLSLEDIRARRAIEEMRTLECISNPVGGDLISNAIWVGVSLRELLRESGPKPGGRELKIEGADGYHTSIPLDLALHPHSYLVYEMNGQPLPPLHGWPLRCLFPTVYGQKQPKWVTRLEVITGTHLGHWESQGWSNEAVIQINSRVEAPGHLTALETAPEVEVRGIALSDGSGVERVEVATNRPGEHREAELIRGPTPYVWTEWRFGWKEPQPGSHLISSRAGAGDGQVQKQVSARLLEGTFPDGTSGIHEVVVHIKPESG